MFRYCKDIGLWALDRPMSSCLFRTDWCKAHCYNNKFMRWPTVKAHESKLASYWDRFINRPVERFEADFLSHRRKPVKRFRFCTRGEAFNSVDDFLAFEQLLPAFPSITFAFYTRSWINPAMKFYLSRLKAHHKNVRIVLSFDPSTRDVRLEQDAIDHGYSLSYVGNDGSLLVTESEYKKQWFKCPKTWKGFKKHCAICKGGCFSRTPKRIHLKQH